MRLICAVGLLASFSTTAAAFARHSAFATLTGVKTKVSSNDKGLVKPLFMSTVEVNCTKTDIQPPKVPEGKDEAFPGVSIVNGKISDIDTKTKKELEHSPMRPRSDPLTTSWEGIQNQLIKNFKISAQDLKKYDKEMEDKGALLEIYKAMQLARQFEVACSKQYMVS